MRSEDVELKLKEIVKLFYCLTDKDVFAEVYREQLAKRLLYHRSSSEDAERLMITELKLACGIQYTSTCK